MKKYNEVIKLIDNSNNFGIVINSAVRYALGRGTYVPSSVIAFIKDNLDYICENDMRTIKVMIQDIAECNNYGYEDQKEEWLNLLVLLKRKVLEKENKK